MWHCHAYDPQCMPVQKATVCIDLMHPVKESGLHDNNSRKEALTGCQSGRVLLQHCN